MATVANNNASRQLLDRLLTRNLFTAGGVAVALDVGPDDLVSYQRGEQRMPLPVQAKLADLALRVGQDDADVRRRAVTLRRQTEAASRFEAGASTRTLNGPVLRWW